MIDKNKKMKIILLGAPGSGKGTVSSLLLNNYKLEHISTGNLFRAEVQNNGPLASKIKELMVNGQLIPDDITNKLASNAILKAFEQADGFILDGYPRTMAQAEFLTKICDIDKVFYLNIAPDLLVKRIVGRRICLDCGKNYNIYFSKPLQDGICDQCHLPLSQRKDDNEETLVSRIAEYETKTAPLVDFYQKTGKLINIDATQDIETVYQQIASELEK